MATLPPEAWSLLNAIAQVESAGRYDIMYSPNGQRLISDFASHPDSAIEIPGSGGQVSTAAGRYQFTAPTWRRAAAALGLTDFSPESQDQAAWWLAQQDYRSRTGRDLLADLQAGNIEQVRSGLSDTWRALEDNSSGFMRAMGNTSAPDAGLVQTAGEQIGPGGNMPTYTIQSGDTLGKLADRFGTTVEELARLNNIADPNRIFAGNTLNLPGQGGGNSLEDRLGDIRSRLQTFRQLRQANPDMPIGEAWRQTGGASPTPRPTPRPAGVGPQPQPLPQSRPRGPDDVPLPTARPEPPRPQPAPGIDLEQQNYGQPYTGPNVEVAPDGWRPLTDQQRGISMRQAQFPAGGGGTSYRHGYDATANANPLRNDPGAAGPLFAQNEPPPLMGPAQTMLMEDVFKDGQWGTQPVDQQAHLNGQSVLDALGGPAPAPPTVDPGFAFALSQGREAPTPPMPDPMTAFQTAVTPPVMPQNAEPPLLMNFQLPWFQRARMGLGR